MFSVFEIIAFEPVAVISLNFAENTCYRQSSCYETVLGFQIRLRVILSDSICLRLIGNLAKNSLVQVAAAFGSPEHVDCRMMF